MVYALHKRRMPRRESLRYRNNDERIDVAFCRAAPASILGSLMGSLMMVEPTPFVPNSTAIAQQLQDEQDPSRLAGLHISSFLNHLAGLRGSDPPFPPQQNRVTLLNEFGCGVRYRLNHRRMFLTREGRLGIGPKMAQPGNEVVVFYGARLPFVVRAGRNISYLWGIAILRMTS